MMMANEEGGVNPFSTDAQEFSSDSELSSTWMVLCRSRQEGWLTAAMYKGFAEYVT